MTSSVPQHPPAIQWHYSAPATILARCAATGAVRATLTLQVPRSWFREPRWLVSTAAGKPRTCKSLTAALRLASSL